MRTASTLTAILFVLSLTTVAAAQEEPYTGGEVPDTTVAAGIDAVVQGLTVSFSIPTADPCTWDFGDGETAEGNPVTHTYAEAGNYPVTATCGATVYDSTVTVGPLATTGTQVSTFLLWGGGLLVAGSAAVWLGRKEDEA